MFVFEIIGWAFIAGIAFAVFFLPIILLIGLLMK